MAAGPALADWIRAEQLAPAFARMGRLHLPDALNADYAGDLAACLANDVPWSRSLTIAGKPYDAGLDAMEKLAPADRARIEAALAEGACNGFQYDFESWRLSDRVEAGERTGGRLAPAEAVYDFLNGAAFLEFVRALTGDPRAAYCDAQATRYRAGHFLNVHDDDIAGKHRLYAYVLNLTPTWKIDWGGLLLFHDSDGHVAEGLTPRFNSLNIFRVPQAHSVSQVASFVNASRLSITGWIRAEAARPKP